MITPARIHALPIAAVGLILAAPGCGSSGSESKEAKATSAVCDARADIREQTSSLAALTPSTVTKDAVESSLAAIREDLTTIKKSRGDLSGERKSQVQEANDAFAAEVRSTASTVGESLSVEGAKAQVTTALQQLADVYKTSFAKIDCSG